MKVIVASSGQAASIGSSKSLVRPLALSPAPRANTTKAKGE
jgi:hypothetical protein